MSFAKARRRGITEMTVAAGIRPAQRYASSRNDRGPFMTSLFSQLPKAWSLAPLAVSLLALTSASRLAAQEAPDSPAELARRVIAAAGGIKAGEIVLLDGGRHTIPYMEAVAVEVIRAGSVPAMYVRTGPIIRAYFFELPAPRMRAADSADAVLYTNELRYTNLFINFPQSEDPEAFRKELSSDSARQSALDAVHELTRARIDSVRNLSQARFVFVNYPPVRAALLRSGMDSGTFSQMQWSAVTADQIPMEGAGRRIAQLLERGRVMRITTPDGTDLRLPLGNRTVTVNTGVIRPDHAQARLAALRTVTLPGGQLIVAPVETSGSGRVMVRRARCDGQPLVNARFELRAGRVANFRADSGGACVTDYLARNASPADRLGYVMIGLNPALQAVESGSGYYPGLASGLVHVGFGYNADLGGANSTPVEKGFPLLRATVTIDGTVVVRDGRLGEP